MKLYLGPLPNNLDCPFCGADSQLHPSFWGGLKCRRCYRIFNPKNKEELPCPECNSPIKADAMGLYGHSCINQHDCSEIQIVTDVAFADGPDCMEIEEYGEAMYSSMQNKYKPFIHGQLEVAAREFRLKVLHDTDPIDVPKEPPLDWSVGLNA